MVCLAQQLAICPCATAEKRQDSIALQRWKGGYLHLLHSVNDHR